MRIKRAVIRRTRKRKLFRLAKGFVGRKKNVLRTMIEAVHHALAYQFKHRRARKRDFRGLWIVRLNAAVREHGMTYSRFMHALKIANVALDRKMLSHVAADDPKGFGQLVEMLKRGASAQA